VQAISHHDMEQNLTMLRRAFTSALIITTFLLLAASRPSEDWIESRSVEEIMQYVPKEIRDSFSLRDAMTSDFYDSVGLAGLTDLQRKSIDDWVATYSICLTIEAKLQSDSNHDMRKLYEEVGMKGLIRMAYDGKSRPTPNDEDRVSPSPTTVAAGEAGRLGNLWMRLGNAIAPKQIGRASCRERVESSEGAVWLRSKSVR